MALTAPTTTGIRHTMAERCPLGFCGEPIPDSTATATHYPVALAPHLLRCPQCTYHLPEWSGPKTFGCDTCSQTGRARFWRATAILKGGHYHVHMATGRPHAPASVGTLIMDRHDFADLAAQLQDDPAWTVAIIDQHGNDVDLSTVFEGARR